MNTILLLYADDTFLLSDDPIKLQNCLNDFESYYTEWKLSINTSKPKALIFGSNNDNKFKFYINSIEVETIFAKSGFCLQTRTHLAQQAMFLMYQRIFNLNLPLDLILKLFDHTILPIQT